MKRLLSISAFLLLVTSLGFGTQPQEGASAPSLAEIARRNSAARAKPVLQPGKVLTNDDFASSPAEASPNASSGKSQTSGAQAGAKGQPETSASSGGHDEKYFRKAMGELLGKLQMHQRQLQVLQQKLAQDQMQFYSDPNKTLQQEYTRSDVSKMTQDVAAKKQEIESDQKAINDLTDQLRHEGGNPGWIRDAAPIEPSSSAAQTETAVAPSSDANPDDKKKTKDYWQSQFKATRERLAATEDAQKLVEDEVNLLRIQQARELDPNVQNEVKQKLDAKASELESKRAATADAKKALDALEAAFKDSGAPEDWRPPNN
jgi:hypothetical protein